MAKPQHLFRRGNVYYWRRKLVGFSTKKRTALDVQLSLGTTDRALAVKLALTLTLASNAMLDDLNSPKITPQEARAYLKAVIQKERRALAARHTFSKFSPMVDGTAVGEIDDALTWAFPIVWRLIDKHGLNTTFSKTYLSKVVDPQTPDTWVSYLDAMLFFLKCHLLSGYNKETQLDTFEEANGRRPETGFEEFRLQELFIAAMKHLHADSDPADVEKMATESFAEVKDSGSAHAAPVISYSPVETPLGVDQADLQVVSGNLTKTATASQDSTTTLDTSIMAVLERMIEIKQSDEGGLEEKTANHYRSFGRLLIRVTGKDDVRQLTQKDATNFRKALISLPKAFGKSPSHHTRPVSEIIEAAKLLPRDKVGLSVPTVNRYLDQLGTLAAWADSEGISISD